MLALDKDSTISYTLNMDKIHEAIVATFTSEYFKGIRKQIRLEEKDRTWDWHCGGCFGVANALCLALGKKAKKMAVCEFEKDWELPWASHHAIVRVGSEYFDGRGLRTLAQLKREYYVKGNRFEIKPAEDEGVWYADDYYLEPYYKQIKKIFLSHLTR